MVFFCNCDATTHIQSRSVTLCKLDNLEIVPMLCHIPLYLPFWQRRKLRDKFVFSQYFQDVRREMDLCLSRSLESICINSILVQFARFVCRTEPDSASTIYNAFCQVCQTMRALNFVRYFTHPEVLHVSHAADHVPATFR